MATNLRWIDILAAHPDFTSRLALALVDVAVEKGNAPAPDPTPDPVTGAPPRAYLQWQREGMLAQAITQNPDQFAGQLRKAIAMALPEPAPGSPPKMPWQVLDSELRDAVLQVWPVVAGKV